MKINLLANKNKEIWNDFVRNSTMGNFLQTFEWSEFCEKRYGQVWRYEIKEGEKIVSLFFVYPQTLKVGAKILYCPRGPVIADNFFINKKEIFELIDREMSRLAAEQKAWSFKLDVFSQEKVWSKTLIDLNFGKTEEDIQPRHTLILDLRQDLETLQKNMHAKTRYNIRLAEKRGVRVFVDNDQVNDFFQLLTKTESRQKIKMYGKKYFSDLLRLPFAKLYLAEFENKIIAANIMIFWGDTAIYLYGASDYDFREIMAPHLLQFEAIKIAKSAGYWFYDFWGAAPKNSIGREQNWSGFTRFKMGFSPEAEITEYLGTYEKVYQPFKFGVYNFIKKIFRK